MPCLLVIFAYFFPRLVIVLVAIFTRWFGAAFGGSAIWPVLGFIFMPYTTLAYTVAMINNGHTVSGLWLILVIVAAIVDLGGQGSGARRRSRRRS